MYKKKKKLVYFPPKFPTWHTLVDAVVLEVRGFVSTVYTLDSGVNALSN